MISRLLSAVENAQPVKIVGKVKEVIGLVIESIGPRVSIGELCDIHLSPGNIIKAQVVGFRRNDCLLMPIGEMTGIKSGCEVHPTGAELKIKVGPSLLGRIVSGFGEPMDGKGPFEAEELRSIYCAAPNPLTRRRIKEKLSVGIKAIDGCLTLGKGQRMGVFSGSGVGKSTIMGMVARFTEADINVIALIGERGREVRDFIEKDLGEEGLKRSVVVVATSDQPPLIRKQAAFVATAIAEYFRDQGKDVMFMMDSVTRFARAQREIGLAVGEPPATRGFTPSVFEILPKLLERSGTSDTGTITALYTILVDADDMNEPIADNVRGILDGHIVLSRALAAKGHYPAIDVMDSVSRVMIDIIKKEHQDSVIKLKELIAVYKEAEDLINIGAYVKGANPKIDAAVLKIDKINGFLKQGIYDAVDFEESVKKLTEIAGQ